MSVTYEQWIMHVSATCYRKLGMPWRLVPIAQEEAPKVAFQNGQSPEEFVEEYIKTHKPCVAPELFY